MNFSKIYISFLKIEQWHHHDVMKLGDIPKHWQPKTVKFFVVEIF